MIDLFATLDVMVEQESMCRIKHMRIPRINIYDYDTGRVYVENMMPSDAKDFIFNMLEYYVTLKGSIITSLYQVSPHDTSDTYCMKEYEKRRGYSTKDIISRDLIIVVKVIKKR